MDHIRNDEQKSDSSKDLRDNFKNIQEFMNAQNYDRENLKETSGSDDTESRDNFKNIQKFMNARNYSGDQ